MIIETNTTEKETQAYVDYLENKYNRRITGYLVGSMEHWNNAKTAEEHDRVKHSTSEMETL